MPERWIYNESTLINGMKTFYQKTGVQPYLVLMPSVNGNKYPTDTELTNYLATVYDNVMPDGGHLVVGFLEGNSGDYAIGCYAGLAAETVMDNEAQDILLDYLEYYYESDLEDEAYFATVFEKTAEKIMHVDEVTAASRNGMVTTIVIIVGLIAIGIIITVAVVKTRRAKAEQAKADAQILNTSLEDLTSAGMGEQSLKDKYGVK